MFETIPIYQAKRDFSAIVRDSSERGKVFVVGNTQRRDAPRSLVIGEAPLHSILNAFSCHPQWEEDEKQGLFTAYIPEIDMWGQGTTRKSAAEDALAAAREYSDLYVKDVDFYNRVGRGKHFPFLLRLWLSSTDSDAMKVLGFESLDGTGA